MGISYGGISQLFVGATRPPSLGGDHAALGDRPDADHALSRAASSTPASRSSGRRTAIRRRQAGRPRTRGQAWAYERIQEGDADLQGEPGAAHRGGQPAGARSGATTPTSRRSPIRSRRSPSSTRSTCRRSWPASGRTSRPAATARPSPSRFTGTDKKWFTFTNGTHVDSLAPRPSTAGTTSSSSTSRSETRSSTRSSRRRAGRLPGRDGHHRRDPAARPDPARARLTTSALAAFEALPPVRILFDNGAGGAARLPVPGLRARRSTSFPVAGHEGALVLPRRRRRRAGARQAARRARRDTFTLESRTPARRPNFTGDTGAGRRRPLDGDARLPVDAEPGRDRGLLRERAADRGHDGARRRARCEAWIRSSAPDVDLQVTVTEVRPDGKETFVQGGWLRGSLRKLDRKKSTQARAGAEPARAPTPSRCRPGASPRSRCRSTTRATSTAPARRSGSRSAPSAATSRSGPSPRRSRRARAKIDGRPLAEDALALLLPVVDRASTRRPGCRRARACAASRAATTSRSRTAKHRCAERGRAACRSGLRGRGRVPRARPSPGGGPARGARCARPAPAAARGRGRSRARACPGR